MSTLARRMELNSKIRELRREKSKLEKEIRKLEALKEDLGGCINEAFNESEGWINARTSYMAIPLATVRVVSQFEGYTAQRLAEEIHPTIMDINIAEQKVSEVTTAITSQIEVLDEDINNLRKEVLDIQEKIDALQAELEALG